MASGRQARAVRALSPPEATADSYGGMQSVGVRLQVLVGLVGLGIVWLTPGLEQRERAQITALLFGFIAYTVAAAWVARRSAVLRLATFATDLAALFSFAFVVPDVRVAIYVAAVLVITFHTHASGRALGFALAGGIALFAGLVELLRVDAPERLNGFTLVIGCLLLVVLVVMVDGLSAERRRVARRLTRLNRSLTTFVPGEDLGATLQSAADTAREAVDAAVVTIGIREDGDIAPAAQSGFEPSAVGATIEVPLGSGDSAIGTITAKAAAGATFDDDDRTVLAAYAAQVAAVLARALAYERERQAAAGLRETERLQSEFVTTVSHELRTPLTAVSGFVDTVLLRWTELDDDAKRELLERASWNAGELRRLVEQVLEFSTISAGGRELVLVPQRLAAVTEQLVQNMHPVIGDHDVAIEVPGDVVVLADEEALNRVLGNLLTNAAKYSPPGTCITIAGEAGPARVTVSVSDEGEGIPEDEQERVFERFYRSDSAVRVRGTGIGLTIVRTYVERMGGKVWATSEPGKGSTFCFTLPLAEGPAIRPR
jgi:signal transduction histidine kinase